MSKYYSIRPTVLVSALPSSSTSQRFWRWWWRPPLSIEPWHQLFEWSRWLEWSKEPLSSAMAFRDRPHCSTDDSTNFHPLPNIGSNVGSLQRPLKGSQTQQMYLFYAAEVGTGTNVEPESRNSPFPLSSQCEGLSIKVVWKRNAKWIPWACLDFSRATKILHHPKWKMPEDLFRYPQNVIKSQNSQNVIIRLPVV